MLLLVTVLLVLAGLILLVVGFLQNALNLIYLSIGCTAVAGVALIVFSRLSRRRAVQLATAGATLVGRDASGVPEDRPTSKTDPSSWAGPGGVDRDPGPDASQGGVIPEARPSAPGWGDEAAGAVPEEGRSDPPAAEED